MTCHLALNLANMGVFPSFVYKMQKCDLRLNERVNFLAIQNADESKYIKVGDTSRGLYSICQNFTAIYPSCIIYYYNILLNSNIRL